MKNIKLHILIFIVSFISCKSEVKNEVVEFSKNNEHSERLDDYFQALKKLKKFNGVVLVQKEGKQLLFEAYNMFEDQENSLYVNKQSQFDIHSISKLMAKAAVVDLEKKSLISTRDHISKFIKGFPNGEIITIKHLIDNQSGLPRGFTEEIPNLIEKNPDELIELIAKEKLLFQPGAETAYSNLGYQLLYFIISKVVNKPFVQYINEIYFKPLKMDNTGAHFHLNNNNLNNLVKNHEIDNGEIVVVPNIENDGKNQAKIYSTVEDLLIFINNVKSKEYSSKIKNNKNRIGWSGGGNGILSHAEHNIANNYELVFFSNYDEIPFGDILSTVEKIITNKPYELPKKINRIAKEVSMDILKNYEGKYRLREFNNNIFEYRIEEKNLVFYQNGERGGILNAETDSTFFDAPDAEDFFEFRQITDGKFKLIFHYKKIEIEGKKENAK